MSAGHLASRTLRYLKSSLANAKADTQNVPYMAVSKSVSPGPTTAKYLNEAVLENDILERNSGWEVVLAEGEADGEGLAAVNLQQYSNKVEAEGFLQLFDCSACIDEVSFCVETTRSLLKLVVIGTIVAFGEVPDSR